MIAGRTLDVSALPDYAISNEAPLWWGQFMLVFIEGTMFAILIAMYFYYRLRLDVWPPPGVQLPPVLPAAIALVPFLVSCVGSYRASEAAKRDDRRGMTVWLAFNVVFAVAALVLRAITWSRLNFNQASDIHGSVVWTILGLHTLDAFADIVFSIVLLAALLRGYHGPRQRIGVHVDSVVWYFVVAIWLPLYAVIYWGPHIVGAPR
jgi:heme/copper-type cytochrome/quinol oxidase subunit 3